MEWSVLRRLGSRRSGIRTSVIVTLIGLAALSASARVQPVPPSPSEPPRATPGQSASPALSVMTYNVHGLPFPIALGRAAMLHEIGTRLATLRRSGTQPHVVLLQEAFTDGAKQIAALGGYRYVAYGPQPRDAASPAPTMSGVFRAAASWRKGETEGKWVDSGLVVMSDYPILRTDRLAFPADTCAGFDCLATKGILLAFIAVPGQSAPIAIADTHLNSRHASGVPVDRANAAFAAQFAIARDFIRRNVPATAGLVFGGDFNIGHDAERLTLARVGPVLGGAEATAVVAKSAGAMPLGPDVEAVEKRAKDKQYFRSGTAQALRLMDVRVPFGIASGGNALSDHLGYIADYRL